MSIFSTLFNGAATLAAATLLATAGAANGLLENRPWQFQTSADKANKAIVLDLIERKKGGFFDGFDNITNIGAQVNCNNSSNSTGNIADNGQAGPTTSSNGTPTISSDSTANSDTTSAQSDGSANGGTVGNDTTNQASSQTNSGDVDSAVDNSSIDNSFGDVLNGDTNQALNNTQDNLGNQVASIEGSTACNFTDATFSRPVPSGSGSLN